MITQYTNADTHFFGQVQMKEQCSEETPKSRNADRAKLSIEFQVTLTDYVIL